MDKNEKLQNLAERLRLLAGEARNPAMREHYLRWLAHLESGEARDLARDAAPPPAPSEDTLGKLNF